MNNERWKQELQGLKLSAQQKQQMKDRVQAQPIKRENKPFSWSWLIAPAFVGLLGFCMLLFFTDAPVNPLQHQGSQPLNVEQKNDFKTRTYSSLAIGILLLLNGFVAMVTIVLTKRWQGTFINKVRKIIIKTRYLQLFFSGFFLGFFASFLNALQVSAQIKGMLIYVCLLSLVLLLILYSARNQGEQVCCPHCQHVYTKKEKRKLMTRFTIQMQCHICGGKLFYAKKTRQVSGIITFVFTMMIFLPSNFGIPLWLTFGGAIAMYSIGFVYLLPLFLELEGEEKPLF